MIQPLVAISTDVHISNNSIWYGVPKSYLQAITKSTNFLPILIPSLGHKLDINTLLHLVDGILLTGSESNICPSFYNESPTEPNGPYDLDRDATTLPLIRKALKSGIPILAICRGMQELNVALGGTLATEIHEKEGIMDHRSEDNDCEHETSCSHFIEIEKNSYLESIIGTNKISVNSSHRQAIENIAEGLRIEARAPDNTIEAVWVKDSKTFALGVQWHPERLINTQDSSKKIFMAFGQAVHAHAKTKSNNKG